MGLKVCVSAGHGPNTAGKRAPDGFREFQFTYPTAQYVCQYLLEYENIQVKKVYSQNSDMPLQTRTNTANSWGADLYVSIHGNANGSGSSWHSAHGIETLVYSTAAANVGYKVAQKVQAKLINATKFTNRGVKARPDLWEMRKTTMPAFLCECGFYTNQKEKMPMATSAYQQKVARAIVEGIADYYNLKKKASSIPAKSSTATDGKLYRVQVGAYSNLASAQQQLSYVKASGFKDAYIKTENKLHRIQVGAFSKYSNAQKKKKTG